MGPVQVADLTVALEYSQFSLVDDLPPDMAADVPDRVLEEAIAGQGIAGTHGNEYLVVLSPHQVNGAMPCGSRSGRASRPTTSTSGIVPVPPGRYAVRIAGRGFVRRGWPGSATPGDRWRLQLWPAPGPIRPRRLRAWRDPAEVHSMEGSGWAGDLDQLRAPDAIPWLGDPTREPPQDG